MHTNRMLAGCRCSSIASRSFLRCIGCIMPRPVSSSPSLSSRRTFPDLTLSAHLGPYCGIPSAISSQASTVGALHRSMGIEAASRSNRSFSAYPSSVRGDQLRPRLVEP
uniref:Uncharacterized protein n=1 Tax=Cacopsylla melanoneura TaxID=428564 RepID=A0A8D9F4E5_9HEMI